MSRWPYRRLGEICSTTSGGTPSRSHQEYFGGGIPWIKSGDLTDGDVIDCEETITEEAIRHSSAKLFRQGTVLIAMYGATVGKLGMLGIEAATNQAVCGISTPEELDKWFLFFFLLSQRQKLIEQSAGGAQPNISQKIVRELLIPVPPLCEQHRIVDILSRAEGIVRLRREAQKKAAELVPGIFLDMFGDPATNPKGWPLIKICESRSRVQIGPFGSLLHKEDYVSGGVPLINPMHIIKGRIEPGMEQTVREEKAAELSNYRMEAGDVVMGRRGEMGRCAIVSQEEAGMLCGTGSLFVRPAPAEFSPMFLSAVLSSSQMKRHLESLSQGVTLANLNRSMIEGLQLPLPPMDLQQVFAQRVKEAESIQFQQASATAKAEATFAALLAEVFNA